MRVIRYLFASFFAALFIATSSVSAQEDGTSHLGLDLQSIRRILAGECIELPNTPEVRKSVIEAFKGLKDYARLMKEISELEALLRVLRSTPETASEKILDAEAKLLAARLVQGFSSPDTGVLYTLLLNCVYQAGRVMDGVVF